MYEHSQFLYTWGLLTSYLHAPPPPFHADGVPRPACNTNSSQRGENDDVKGSGVVLGPVVLGGRAAGVWLLTPKIDRATWPFLKFDRAT